VRGLFDRARGDIGQVDRHAPGDPPVAPSEGQQPVDDQLAPEVGSQHRVNELAQLGRHTAGRDRDLEHRAVGGEWRAKFV